MKSRIFIGSSVEGKNVAYNLQRLLDYDAEVTVWDQGVFHPSKYPLESLAAELSKNDFSIFIFHPDDNLTSRGIKKKSVRDNVIFEFGLAMGLLGRDRTIIVLPKENKNLAIPSDLLGLTYLVYNSERSDGRISAALGPVALSIREHIAKLGSRYMNIFDGEVFSDLIKQNRAIHKKSIDQLTTAVSNAHQRNDYLAIFDIDNFYGMNLVYGAEICNEIVNTIKKILQKTTPYLYQIGGDKFAVIAPFSIIEQLHNDIKTFAWEKLRSGLYVTCSIGYSKLTRKEKPEQIIIRALQGLKISKKEGKNLVSEGPMFVEMKSNMQDLSES